MLSTLAFNQNIKQKQNNISKYVTLYTPKISHNVQEIVKKDQDITIAHNLSKSKKLNFSNLKSRTSKHKMFHVTYQTPCNN